MYLLKLPLIPIYSQSLIAIDQVQSVYPILACYVFLDCLQSVEQGLITGLGKQGSASKVTTLTYLCVGIPVSVIYTFYFEGGMFGLWLGPTMALTINYTFYQALVGKLDF